MARSIGINFEDKVLQILREKKKEGESMSKCVNRLLFESFSATLLKDLQDKNNKLLKCYEEIEELQHMVLPSNAVGKRLAMLFRNEGKRLPEKVKKSFFDSLLPEEQEVIKKWLA